MSSAYHPENPPSSKKVKVVAPDHPPTTHNTRERTSTVNSNFMNTPTSLGGIGIGITSPSSTSGLGKEGTDFTSFLEGVMTEEERRTRTRHLPDVEGFTNLSKMECKSDLKDARSWDFDNDTTDLNNDNTYSNNDDNGEAGVFVSPDINNFDDLDVKGNNMDLNTIPTVSSFNPPRPPESSGNNKKKRMVRWEKSLFAIAANPSDTSVVNEIAVDLETYRRTVRKTRSELEMAELEREKVEAVSHTLRCHFMDALSYVDEEARAICNVIAKVSKGIDDGNTESVGTRKRKSLTVKDLVSSLTTKGDRIAALDPTFKSNLGTQITPGMNLPDSVTSVLKTGGIGGIQISQTSNSTPLAPVDFAERWLLPGETVSTKYGIGVIENILPNVSVKGKGTVSHAQSLHLLPPRCVVKLPYGVAYMAPTEVKSLTKVCSLNDEALVDRWIKMIETAHFAASFVDVDAMAFVNASGGRGYDVPFGEASLVYSEKVSTGESGDDAMDQDGDAESAADNNSDSSSSSSVTPASRLLRFGSTLLPTPGGLGAPLSNMPLQQLRQCLTPFVCGRLTKGAGFTADDAHNNSQNPSNPHSVLPPGFREWEDSRSEIYKLKASLLQLKNISKRQSIARSMYEKAYNLAKNHQDKLQLQLEDMKVDLNTLKVNCRAELTEIGIDDDMARSMLRSKLSLTAVVEGQVEAPPKVKLRKPTAVAMVAMVPRVSKRNKKGDEDGEASGNGGNSHKKGKGKNAAGNALAGETKKKVGLRGGAAKKKQEAAAAAALEEEAIEANINGGGMMPESPGVPNTSVRRAPKRGRAEEGGEEEGEEMAIPPVVLGVAANKPKRGRK